MQTDKNNFLTGLSAQETRAVYEVRLQHLWNNVDISQKYFATGNRPVEIISGGTWNLEAGPDFKNAKVVLDGKRISGDIEIHHKSSDWFRHKHHLDHRYDNVILHLVETDDATEQQALELPPVITFKDLKTRKLPEEYYHKGKCEMFFSGLSDESVNSFLCAAGMHRFQEKVGIILEESIRCGADYACLKLIFKALGYKSNQSNFLELFERFMSYHEDILNSVPEIVLWGESGLIPDPLTVKTNSEMMDFIKNTWSKWAQVRKSDSKPIKWVRSGGRPYNSPERRVAALGRLIKLTGIRPLTLFAEKRQEFKFPKDLNRYIISTFTCSDELWDNYINFTTKAKKNAVVIGKSRASELALNVVLPSLYVFGRMDEENLYSDLCEFAQSAWMQLPPTPSNRFIKISGARWLPERSTSKIFSSAASCQGVLHLYKEYCEKCQTDCNSCILYNSL